MKARVLPRTPHFLLAAFAFSLAATTAVSADPPNYGPTPFKVYPPKDVAGVPGHVIKVFSWTRSTDPEGGIIHYRFSIFQNEQEIFRREEILETMLALDLTAEVPEWTAGEEWRFEVVALDPFWQEELPTFALPPDSADEKSGAVSSVTVPAYVWGYVYDKETEQPVVDALVYTPKASMLSDDGTYGLEVQAGATTFAILAEGYEPYSLDLEMTEGEVVCINVAMVPNFQAYRGTLWGAVRDGTTRNLVDNARIFYGDQELTVDGGSYLLTLPEGNYTLRCIADGFEEIEKVILLRRNQTTPLHFNLIAVDEHVWAKRQTYNPSDPDATGDPRFLDVSFSGLSDAYDIYIAAQLPDRNLYCLVNGDAGYGMPNAITPLAAGVELPDGSYPVKIIAQQKQTDGIAVTVFVVATRPGADVADPDNWEAYAAIAW